jgi:hypothetical protein
MTNEEVLAQQRAAQEAADRYQQARATAESAGRNPDTDPSVNSAYQQMRESISSLTEVKQQAYVESQRASESAQQESQVAQEQTNEEYQQGRDESAIAASQDIESAQARASELNARSIEAGKALAEAEKSGDKEAIARALEADRQAYLESRQAHEALTRGQNIQSGAETVELPVPVETQTYVPYGMVEVKLSEVPLTQEEQQTYVETYGDQSPKTKMVLDDINGKAYYIKPEFKEAYVNGVPNFSEEQVARIEQINQESLDVWLSSAPQELKDSYEQGGLEGLQKAYESLPLIYNYTSGKFEKTTQEGLAERERLYEIFPDAASGKIALPEAIEQAKTNFDSSLKELPQEVQDAYKTGGYGAFKTAYDSYIDGKVKILNTAKIETEIPKNWQDIETGDLLTDEERNQKLESNPNASIVRHIPQIADTVAEALSLGKVETATYNKDDIERQYEIQRDVAEAVAKNDTTMLEGLYKQGAFGEDQKGQTWLDNDPVAGAREITPEERKQILSSNPSARDSMSFGKGKTEIPVAYSEALRMVDQQKEIENAVKVGDTAKLDKLYASGAFGDDNKSYTELVEYVKSGGRELVQPTQEDINAVRDSFGTKEQYYKEVIDAQPTNFELAKNVGIAMIPVYGTIKTWDEMDGKWKAGSIALDVLTFVPIVGGLAAAAKVSAGVGKSARIIAATKAIPKIAVSEIKAPYTAIRHPVNTVKQTASEMRNLGGWLLDPRQVPINALTTTYGTVRLDANVVGSPEAAMYVRDELMKLQAVGKEPVVTFAGKEYRLREPSFMKGGGLATGAPDIKWVDVEGGATVQTKVYPEGHPLAGQRVKESEQGLFTANALLERFTSGSAFGHENIGAMTIDDKIKLIQDTAIGAKNEGNIRLSNKLDNLVKKYENAKISKDVTQLDKTTANIEKEVTNLANQEKLDTIYRLKLDASEKYKIGDIEGSQQSMKEAVELERGLTKKSGFAVFSPETSVYAVPSNKVYLGAIFQPKWDEIWQIMASDLKNDKAAQLLLEADNAKKVGDYAIAERLSDEAHSLIRDGKSGFKRVTTAEMELKFPEYFKLPEMKERYFTTGEKGRLSIFTDKPYDFKQVLKSKLLAPIETVRQLYSPAISAKSIPLTDAGKLELADNLIKEADALENLGDVTKARMKRIEAGILRRNLSNSSHSGEALETSRIIDEVDEYTQAAQKAESLGDYVSANRLIMEAEAIRSERLAGREFSREMAERAGTVAGVFEDVRILGYRPEGYDRQVDSRVSEVRGLDRDVRDITSFDGRDFEIREPEIREPQIRELEIREPEIREPEIREPDVRLPDSREPDMREPDVREPETREPDVREPEIREPEIPQPETRVPLGLKDDKDKQSEILKNPPPGTIVIIQGRPTHRNGGKAPMFKVLVHPYKEFFTTRETPSGYDDKGYSGEGSAFKSIQILNGLPPSKVENVDLGFFKVNVDVENGKPVVSFIQSEDANTGERSQTIGMGEGQIPIEEWREAKKLGIKKSELIKGKRLVPDKRLLVTDDRRIVKDTIVPNGNNNLEGYYDDESDDDLIVRKKYRSNKNWWYDPQYENPIDTMAMGNRYYKGKRVLPPNLGGSL